MKRTVCELFAGVGGFRCGLNNIKTIEDAKKPERWDTVWFSQWEPADKKTQWAWSCYTHRFGYRLDKAGKDTTNIDISEVDKLQLPDFNLLVGGFPCQDYSVANSLATSKGIEGKKGVLFWSILDTIEKKHPSFILLENVDRLLKSPAKQRGRDFGIILACLRDEDYTVEWRVINAADYGYQQRRRRVFIFAYRNDTNFAKRVSVDKDNALDVILSSGFFAQSFPVELKRKNVSADELPKNIVKISDNYRFSFENAGVMRNGNVYTVKTNPIYEGEQITLGDIIEKREVKESFFIPEERLYYTSPEITHSDESKEPLSKEARKTWQYIKGAKKIPRAADNGHEYFFSEGPVPMVDEYDKPARTMLTSEGNFSRTTHIVRDKNTGKIRLLTPVEMERIQGFPDDWTKECFIEDKAIEMPLNKRRFMMGNALVVNLITQMEPLLSKIIEEEP